RTPRNEIAYGSAISLTDAGPRLSRVTISTRIGSASAANAWSTPIPILNSSVQYWDIRVRMSSSADATADQHERDDVHAPTLAGDHPGEYAHADHRADPWKRQSATRGAPAAVMR